MYDIANVFSLDVAKILQNENSHFNLKTWKLFHVRQNIHFVKQRKISFNKKITGGFQNFLNILKRNKKM